MNEIKRPKIIRLEKELYSIPGRIYSITIVANFRNQYFTNHQLNYEIIDCLKECRKRMSCTVYVYSLMPEHLHLLNGTIGSYSIIDFINQFKGKSTRIAWKYGIKGVLWQRRWYDHILRKDEDIVKTGEYILNNCVRRGLVEDWHKYPYCGYLDEFDI